MSPLIQKFLDQSRTEKIGTVIQVGTRVSSGYELIRTIFNGLIFCLLGIFVFLFFNKWIGLGLILMGVVIPIAKYKNRKKEMSLLYRTVTPLDISQINTDGEEVKSIIVGVMGVGIGAMTITLGGGGELKRPENTIILTNKNIWFIYIPLQGTGIVTETAGDSATAFDFMFGKSDLQNKVNEIYDKTGIRGLIATSASNYAVALADLQSVELDALKQVLFTTINGQKFKYGIWKEEDRQRLLSLNPSSTGI